MSREEARILDNPLPRDDREPTTEDLASSLLSLPPGYRRRILVNWLMYGLATLATICAIVVFFALLGFLLVMGIKALNLDFFLKLPAAAGELGGGMANAILGTLTLLGLACCIGVPSGVFTGIYLAEYDTGTNRLAALVRFLTEVLTGIPTIIMGILAYVLIVLTIGNFSALAGGFALGIIMVPTLARTTEEVLRLVPQSLREAALALGASQWYTILKVILPAAKGGIATGIVLSLARVAGETAPLILTALGSEFFQTALTKPIDALPLRIYKYATGPYDIWHQQAYAGALLLIMGLVISSLILRLSTQKAPGEEQ